MKFTYPLMYLHIHKYKMKFIDLRKIQVLVYNKKKVIMIALKIEMIIFSQFFSSFFVFLFFFILFSCNPIKKGIL